METLLAKNQRLLELLGHGESPFGVCYTDVRPEGYGPGPGEIFSREREAAEEIDWRKAADSRSCIIGNIWLARKKRKAAWISHAECGCMGGGYFSGVYGPYLERNAFFVSTGIPNTPIEGEHYMPSPESMKEFLEDCALPLNKGKYCVFKPLEQFTGTEQPLAVIFFARPEVLTGLYSLVTYAVGNHNAVRSPFGSGCTNIISWPLVYEQRGMECAVLGGFDPSARKFMQPDELTLAVPLALYCKMLDSIEKSALTRHTWEGVRKKAMKSTYTWKNARGDAQLQD